METVCNLQLFKNPLFYQLKWYLVSFKMGDCIDLIFFFFFITEVSGSAYAHHD